MQTAQTTGDQSALSHALGTLGNIYWNQGDYPQALEHLERYLQLSQALGDPRGQSRAASGLGLVYWHKGDYARAREYYEQDLALATQIGDQAGVAKTLGNMGIIDWFLGAPSAALQRFHQQYTIAQQIGDRRVVGIALGNLGEIYRYQGDYASARLCYTHGLQVALEIGNRRGMMVAVGNLAILALLEDHDSAQALLQRAITLGRTLNIPYYLCEYLQLEARRMRALDLHAAQAANAEALQIAQQIGRKEILFAAQVLEAQLNNGLGQSSPALEALQATWTDPAQQAALAYARWQLDGSPAQRAEACRQYRALYEKSPLLEYRQHWTELAEPGADPLPAPPQLPPPPEALAEAPVDKMLAQVDALIESLSRPSRNLGP